MFRKTPGLLQNVGFFYNLRLVSAYLWLFDAPVMLVASTKQKDSRNHQIIKSEQVPIWGQKWQISTSSISIISIFLQQWLMSTKMALKGWPHPMFKVWQIWAIERVFSISLPIGSMHGAAQLQPALFFSSANQCNFQARVLGDRPFLQSQRCLKCFLRAFDVECQVMQHISLWYHDCIPPIFAAFLGGTSILKKLRFRNLERHVCPFSRWCWWRREHARCLWDWYGMGKGRWNQSSPTLWSQCCSFCWRCEWVCQGMLSAARLWAFEGPCNKDRS